MFVKGHVRGYVSGVIDAEVDGVLHGRVHAAIATGGIVDVAVSENKGVRIEFWGDEVDSIRYFNIVSQRSTENIGT